MLLPGSLGFGERVLVLPTGSEDGGPVWRFLVFLGMGQKLCLYLARDRRGIRLWCPTFQLWRKVVISGSS